MVFVYLMVLQAGPCPGQVQSSGNSYSQVVAGSLPVDSNFWMETLWGRQPRSLEMEVIRRMLPVNGLPFSSRGKTMYIHQNRNSWHLEMGPLPQWIAFLGKTLFLLAEPTCHNCWWWRYSKFCRSWTIFPQCVRGIPMSNSPGFTWDLPWKYSVLRLICSLDSGDIEW